MELTAAVTVSDMGGGWWWEGVGHFSDPCILTQENSGEISKPVWGEGNEIASLKDHTQEPPGSHRLRSLWPIPRDELSNEQAVSPSRSPVFFRMGSPQAREKFQEECGVHSLEIVKNAKVSISLSLQSQGWVLDNYMFSSSSQKGDKRRPRNSQFYPSYFR